MEARLYLRPMRTMDERLSIIGDICDAYEIWLNEVINVHINEHLELLKLLKGDPQ